MMRRVTLRRCTAPMSRDLNAVLDELLPYDILNCHILGNNFRLLRITKALANMECLVPVFVQRLVEMQPDDISTLFSEWKFMIGRAEHVRTLVEQLVVNKWTPILEEAKEHFGPWTKRTKTKITPFEDHRVRRAFSRLAESVLQEDFYLLVRFTVLSFINDKRLIEATQSVRRLSEWETVTTDENDHIRTELLQHRLLPDPRHFLYRVQRLAQNDDVFRPSWSAVLRTTGLHTEDAALIRFLRLWTPDVGPHARPVEDVRRPPTIARCATTENMTKMKEMQEMNAICTRFDTLISRVDIMST